MHSRTSRAGGGRTRSRGLVAARSRAVDFYFSRPIDNTGLVLNVDPRKRRHCFAFLFFGVCAFLMTLGYALHQFECLRLQYRMAALKARHHTLSEWNHKLRLEKASLGRLERIEGIARKELGFQPIRPEQVIYLDRKTASELNFTLAHNENRNGEGDFSP